MDVQRGLNKLFGGSSDGKISDSQLRELLRHSWMGKMVEHEGLRAICWRLLLGLLPSNNSKDWVSTMEAYAEKYAELKTRVMPSIDKVKVDPLSALSDGDDVNEEWTNFYKHVELISFIKGDLDRLYLTGVEDNFFQTKAMRSMLIPILFIWSYEHSYISYRQGMHEIAGIVMYSICMEQRLFSSYLQANSSASSNPLVSLLANDSYIECWTYMLFERILVELEVLYDPLPLSGAESLPYIVQYCTKIQEHYLRILDPQLCQHIENVYIQPQIYGLRWARLLLAREFVVTHESLYVLWDYMFASVFDTERYLIEQEQRKKNQEESDDEDDMMVNMYSVLAAVKIQKNRKDCNAGRRLSQGDRCVYVCSPMLGALGDFMLAMMIQIRAELLEGDQNVVMALLMRYPDTLLQPIIETADMIRRGVIVRDLTAESALLSNNYEFTHHANNNANISLQGARRRFSAHSNNTIKKVAEGLSSLKVGISELWGNIGGAGAGAGGVWGEGSEQGEGVGGSEGAAGAGIGTGWEDPLGVRGEEIYEQYDHQGERMATTTNPLSSLSAAPVFDSSVVSPPLDMLDVYSSPASKEKKDKLDDPIILSSPNPLRAAGAGAAAVGTGAGAGGAAGAGAGAGGSKALAGTGSAAHENLRVISMNPRNPLAKKGAGTGTREGESLSSPPSIPPSPMQIDNTNAFQSSSKSISSQVLGELTAPPKPSPMSTFNSYRPLVLFSKAFPFSTSPKEATPGAGSGAAPSMQEGGGFGGDNPMKKRESIGGVGLTALSFSTTNSTSSSSSTLPSLLPNQSGGAVADRLQEISEQIVSSLSIPEGVSGVEGGEEIPYAELRERLLLLCGVLRGQQNIVDYDARFANRILTLPYLGGAGEGRGREEGGEIIENSSNKDKLDINNNNNKK